MSKRTLIRCKKCDRPLGDTREDKIRVMQFYKNEKGYTEIKEIFTFIMKNLNRVKKNIYKGI